MIGSGPRMDDGRPPPAVDAVGPDLRSGVTGAMCWQRTAMRERPSFDDVTHTEHALAWARDRGVAALARAALLREDAARRREKVRWELPAGSAKSGRR